MSVGHVASEKRCEFGGRNRGLSSVTRFRLLSILQSPDNSEVCGRSVSRLSSRYREASPNYAFAASGALLEVIEITDGIVL
jgi:hypothetical protein